MKTFSAAPSAGRAATQQQHKPNFSSTPLPSTTLSKTTFFSNPVTAPMANNTRKATTTTTTTNLVGSSQLWLTILLASVALNLLAGWFALPTIKTRLKPAVLKKKREPATSPAAINRNCPMERVDEINVSATSGSRPNSKDAFINLDHGDPTMYEAFWERIGEKGTITIPGWQKMSYFSDPTNICWFLEPEFGAEIRRLHRLVGNAVTNDRYIIVGTGSTQLFQAALYALSTLSSEDSLPMSVVSTAPYYSSYPAVTDFMKSGLFKWGGDASNFKGNNYIEIICSPSNPDGTLRKAVLSSKNDGKAIHDLAYFWPQYTPITEPADHEIMLFTFSKSTGHAGTRLGWALVKDQDVAQRMMKFIELATIGVSKDSQIRAARIMKVVSDAYENPNADNGDKLFEFGRRLMMDRWTRLREVVSKSDLFSLPEFPSTLCNFSKELTTTYPAFAWLKCERDEIEDCASYLKSHRILVRSGKYSGVEAKYVRVSMLDRDETFDKFLERLSLIQ